MERYRLTPGEIAELNDDQVGALLSYIEQYPWPYTVSVVPEGS